MYINYHKLSVVYNSQIESKNVCGILAKSLARSDDSILFILKIILCRFSLIFINFSMKHFLKISFFNL